MLLDEPTIHAFLADHPQWRYANDALHITLTFDTFMDAVSAFNAIAHAAEAADHHPDLANSYTTLTVALTSHDAGGVTDRDLALATQIDMIVSD